MKRTLLASMMLGALIASADVVTLKSGDRLTGKITGGNATSLKFNADAVGDVSVTIGDIEDMTSSTVLPVMLQDETIVDVTITAMQGNVYLTKTDDGTHIDLKEVDTINPPKAAWTCSLTASYAANRGNTFSDSADVRADLQYRSSCVHRFNAATGYAYGRQRDSSTGQTSTSIDNWFAQAQYDYFMTKKLYTYANARYEQDKIAELKAREIVGIGLGYQWIDTGCFGFNTECGATYYHEEMEDGTARDVPSMRLAYGVYHKVGSYAHCFHNVEYLPDVRDWNIYLLNADLGARIILTANFLLEARAEWRYNSQPLLDGIKKLDSRYTVGLGYTFF